MPSFRFAVIQISAAAAAALLCLAAATQWAAAMLGYQPALGAPLIDVLGVKLYAPWKLFTWWLAFDAQAPHVFARAGALAALGGVLSGALAIGGAARRAGRPRVPTTYGSARWADFADIRDAGLLSNSGLVLGLYGSRYLRHDGPEHVLAVAPTRSGKGVGLVLPTLLTWTGSAVIHDIKGENWQLTAGWRARGSQCLLFDPTSSASARFNPLLEVRKGAHEVRDVQNIADILVDPEGMRERRDHWDKTAHALLTGAILHVLYAEGEKTLARVASFLADPSRSILRTLRIMLTTNHLGTDEAPVVHPVVASVARELLNKSDNERSGVVSTAMSFLGLYRDPIIAANTACSDWRIADLMTGQRPVSLYLVVPPSDISRTRPLVRLILNQIARRLTETLPETRGTARPRLLLMLDEFPALAALEAQDRRRQMLRTAFGPTIAAALADPTVLEVMVNPDGRLWIDRAVAGRTDSGERLGAAETERIIRLVAAHVRREVTDKAPIVSAELPDTGERFEGVMPPVALAPCFAIRKPADVPYRLTDYVAARILTPPQAHVLAQAVRERRNIVVAGGTSSGKTTLVNALLAEVASLNERVVILEDTRELRCAAEDVVALRTKPGVAALADLVRSTLRLRPDRIVVGEVRGAEALDMLKAWNTGHPGGLTTVHANSAPAALTRLEQLVQEAVVTVPRALIAEAIDLIVFIKGRGSERRVESILELAGLGEDEGYVLKPAAAPALHVV